MKRPKKIRLPKKPTSRASLETLKNYLKKVSEINRENKKRESEYKKFQKLHAKIKGM